MRLDHEGAREYRAHAGTFHLQIPGWTEVQNGRDMEVWQDVDGDFLGLVRAQASLALPELCDQDAVRRHCRLLAEGMESGLIEAEVVRHVDGPAVEFICKHLKMPAFVFTGVLMVPTSSASWIWTMSAEERGATGIREGTVLVQLLQEGKASIGTLWARDPYDPTYHDVDQRHLRYVSDEERYDAQFPSHPLSRVRRELRRLLTVELDE